MADSDDDFEEQLRLEAEVKAKEEAAKDPSVKKRVDDDGTEYDWDPKLKAWFPKIDADFIAKYQMNYGTSESKVANPTEHLPTVHSSKAKKTKPTEGTVPAPPAVTDPAYYDWYYKYYYSSANQESDTSTTDSKAYEDYYKQYYAQYYAEQQGTSASNSKDKDISNSDSSSGEKSNNDTTSVKSDNKPTPEEGKEQSENSLTSQPGESSGDDSDYWSYYYNYYGYQQDQQGEAEEQTEEAEKKTEEKKDTARPGEKRKQKDPEWFDAEVKQHNNVYVTGLPTDITELEFEETMKKVGLITQDLKTRKLKLKLYKNKEGNYKGDGLCCYIKPESVDLALQVLDGSEIRGSTINIERATFTLKGDFDVAKAKKKRLNNKEKRRIKEKQAKLLDWRPDEPVGMRPKTDRVVVIKHVFDPEEFDRDPSQINEIRNDIREECGKYGDVRKVVVNDRHKDGVVVVTLREPEEADVCIEAVNGRWFGGKQLEASTWDGKTKYTVEETEEEHNARLKQWENFLEGKETSTTPKEGDPHSAGSSVSTASPAPHPDPPPLSQADQPQVSHPDPPPMSHPDPPPISHPEPPAASHPDPSPASHPDPPPVVQGQAQDPDMSAAASANPEDQGEEEMIEGASE